MISRVTLLRKPALRMPTVLNLTRSFAISQPSFKTPLFNSEQKTALLKTFEETPYPSLDVIEAYSQTTGVTVAQVRTWFANTRRRGTHPGSITKSYFDDDQLKHLNAFFDENKYPDSSEIDLLAETVSMEPKQVSDWFNRGREKYRKQLFGSTESDEKIVGTSWVGVGKFSDQDLKLLNSAFETLDMYPTRIEIDELCHQINREEIKSSKLVNWFQKKRSNLKKQDFEKYKLMADKSLSKNGPKTNQFEDRHLTAHDFKILQETLDLDYYPDHAKVEYLAEKLYLHPSRIKKYFRDRRHYLNAKSSKSLTKSQVKYDSNEDRTFLTTETKRKNSFLLNACFEENIYYDQDSEQIESLSIKLELPVIALKKTFSGKRIKLKKKIGKDLFERLVLEGDFRETVFRNSKKNTKL